MELEQVQALLQMFGESDAVSLKVRCGDTSICMKKKAAFAPAGPKAVVSEATPCAPVACQEEAPAAAESGEFIRAPLVGTFYAASAPGETPFVQVGSQVKSGDTVCLLEAMKMISEVPAPFDCVVEEVMIQDGELAAFDNPLFRVRRL